MGALSLRGWRRGVAIAAGVVGLYAILGFFVVPPVARSQIVELARTKLHREATVARVRFNPFTLAGSVEGLALADRDGAPLFKVDRLAVDLELSGVFRRAWRFREIAVDRPSVGLRVLADGKPSIADLFEAPSEPEPARKSGGLPRLIVDRFALHGGRAEFTDESRSPRFAQVLEPLDLEVRDLTTIPEQSGDNTLTLGLGTGAILRWSGKQTIEPLHLEGRVEVTGMLLSRWWDYAAPKHPLAVTDGHADVALAYDIRRAADGSFVLAMKDADLKLRGVVARPRGGAESWLELRSAEASGIEAAWPDAHVAVTAVKIDDPKVLVRRDAQGAFNWSEAIPAAAPKKEEKEPAKPWTATVKSVEIGGGEVTLDDLAVTPETRTVISKAVARAEGVSTDPTLPVKIDVQAAVNGSGHAAVSGKVVPGPGTAELDVALGALDLAPFQPYAARLPGAEIRRGSASLAGQLVVGRGNPWVRFDGNGSVDGLHIAGAGEDRLVAWDRADARGVRMTLSPDRVRVAEIALDGAFLKLRIDRDGNVNLSKLKESGAAPPSSPAPAAAPPVPLDIGKIVFRKATADYTDESLILPFGTKIHDLNGDIRDISTTAAAPARLSLEGRVAEEGYVKADGTLRIADPFAATDVAVIFRNVNMPELTPYSAQFAGYALARGVLDVDVRYRVEDRHLVGDHHVIAKDLVLGPKVEGAKGPGLPVRLAVALLKDKDGRIDLQVPVEGTVDSPEFNYRSVFWQAFKKILVNVAAAPFRAIGRLFGSEKEDLELVGFASGRSELPAPEKDKLVKLAGELAARSELSLEIEGRFDPVADVEALKRARVEAKIDAKRTPDTNLDAILEALYAETFSKEKLDAKRMELTPPPSPPSKDQAPPPAPFDAPHFYETLRRDLLAAEVVGDADLAALARSRAEAIAAVLTAPGGLDPSRVKLLDPAPVKRKKQGSDLVASEMTMTAKD